MPKAPLPSRPRTVLVIAGPTATGKSALALGLAATRPAVVINADSQQLYRALPILTAQPDAATQIATPHALYGTHGDREPTSAGQWARAAAAAVTAALAAMRLPILVGGTGFYIEALSKGLSPIPIIPDSFREDARAALAALGPEGFHAAVQARDPVSAARLATADSQRLIRAYEVFEATGTPLSAWQALPTEPLLPDCRIVIVRVLPPRDVIATACDLRFDAMIAGGVLDEVAEAVAAGLTPQDAAGRALGYAELLGHYEGRCELDDAIAAAKAATRAYAKRQVTWFRNRLTPDLALNRPIHGDPQFLDSCRQEIARLLQSVALT